MVTPDTVPVCVYGYAETGEVRFEVSDPSGNRIGTFRLNPRDLDQYNAFIFRRLHSDPTGMYTVTVIQGEKATQVTIEVRTATSPQFIGIFDHPLGVPLDGVGTLVTPGDKIRVAVGGYKPNTTVLLHIYSNPHDGPDGFSPVIDYITSHPVTVDALGGGIWELQTTQTDPHDAYVLYSELVTRRMFPSPDAPESPSIEWQVFFTLM